MASMAGEEVGVGGDLEPIGAAEARSALAWWLEAGVDVAVQEQPRNWLKPAPPAVPLPNAKAPEPVAEPLPETLPEFREWLSSSSQLPMARPGARRILPHGPDEAAVMLLAEAPAPEDAAAGQPIGGDAWQLAERMLKAIGLSLEEAYSASLSCVHAPGARLGPKEREACGEIARRHVRLAKPQRLLLLGDGPCVALLGKRLVEARGHVHKVEGVRTVATFHPRHLINRPLDKSLAWKDLLLLMETES
ncbi:uracil-DNA glycosylase [Sphingomonas sp. F9_3S_D5_B_2]